MNRIFLTTLILIFAGFANAAEIDNSDCPTGRKGQAKATRANFINTLSPGTRWFTPGYRNEYFINFTNHAVFKIGYDGQAKKRAREIVIGSSIGGNKFNGELVIGGKLRVQMDEIYFAIQNGRCSLVTKTNPNEYHPSTKDYPVNDMRHHKIQNDDGDFVYIPFTFKKVHVLRQYIWSRDENFL